MANDTMQTAGGSRHAGDAKGSALPDPFRPTGAVRPIRFPEGYRECPVALVAQERLLFRLGNGRLIAQRDRALRDAGLDPAGANEADPAVQGVLGALLVEHAGDERGPILQELERFGRQVEPLLVTGDGVVINGNRRLAAMRELLRREPAKFAAFAEIEVVVLPADTSAAEIEYLEAALQMAPDTKLDYGWANRRLKLRHQRDALGLPRHEIANAYRMDDPERIDREVAELELGEAYLRWIGAPGEWPMLEEAGELIEALAGQLADLDDALADVWREIGFGQLREPGTLDPKRFPFAPPVPPRAPLIAARRLASGLARASGLPEDGPQVSPERARDLLVPLVREAGGEFLETVADTLESLKLEHQARTAPVRALNQLRQAGATLQQLSPESLNEPQRRQLRSDLAALTEQARFVLGDAGNAPKPDGSWSARKGLLDPPYSKIAARILRRVRG